MRHTTHISRPSRLARGTILAALALAAPLALSACTAADGAQDASGSAASSEHQSSDSPVTASETWVKATADDMEPGEGMTGVFGTLTNHTDTDLVITEVTSDAAAHVELHEVVDGMMRAIEGDVVVPANGSFALVPGGNHIMLMGMTDPLLPGDEIVVTLTFSDGSALDLTALVKDTAGANESYGDLEHGDSAQSDDHAGH